MNLLQGKIQCVECKSTKLIKDYKRQELFCSKCGLVLINNDMAKISNKQQLNNKNQAKAKSKKTEKIQYLRLKDYLYNFF